MKFIAAAIITLSAFTFSFAQNEQSPLVEKDVAYKDWVYKNVVTDNDLNLRKFTFNKKLVMVVYFAPWCPNWKHDLPFVKNLYETYKKNGFDVIAVAEYDTVDAIKAHIDEFKLGFPVVWESDTRDARLTTSHYQYRTAAGDTRKWGSPWYVFLDIAKVEPGGTVFTKKTTLVNGELIRPDIEKFIRDKLGLKAAQVGPVAKSGKIEVCEPDKKIVDLKKP